MSYEISHREREDEDRYWDHEFGHDEYAPAQVSPESFVTAETEVRPLEKPCVNCWRLGQEEGKPCHNCGRPQDISELEWLKLKYAPLTCERCGQECTDVDEGFCNLCAGTCRAA